MKASENGLNEEDEAKDEVWKNKTAEILSLMKEMTGRTSEQKLKNNLGQHNRKSLNLKEIGRRLMRKQRNKLSLLRTILGQKSMKSLRHKVSRGRLTKHRRLWDSIISLAPKEAKRRTRPKERVRKRSRRRKSGGTKVKDQLRRRMRGRGGKPKTVQRREGRSKGVCELCDGKEEEEVKIGRKLEAESADPDSISDTDL